MRTRTLLAAVAAGSLLVGLASVPAQAAPGPLPDHRTGQVQAWGTVAAADATDVPEPLDGQQVTNVSAGNTATAAVTADGSLHVWGPGDAAVVTEAPELTDAVAVAIAGSDGVALKQNGTVVGWGAQAGIDEVPGGLTARAVSVNASHAYAVTTAGTLVSWGASDPAPPAGLTGLVDVSTPANTYALALDADGHVTAWGSLAAIPTGQVPAEIQGHVTQIATGGFGAAGAILDDGSIRVWGSGAPTMPTAVEEALEDKRVVALDVGTNVIVATEDGAVHVWGPTAAITTLPDSLDGEHVAAVAMGTNHAAVIATDFRAVAPPTITGTAAVGQTLTATPADFSLEPDGSATGQWLADSEELDGETGTTLEVDASLLGKRISYRSTASRGDTDVTSTSVEVGPVTPATVASTTTVTVTPSAGAYGAARTATATVARPGGTATGTVTFMLGSRRATVPLAGGKASWALPRGLAAGKHRITATYSGDTTTEASASGAIAFAVTRARSRVKAGKPVVRGKNKKGARKVVLRAKVRTGTGVRPPGRVRFVLKTRGKAMRKVKARKRTLAAKVNAKGVAKVALKRVPRGRYTLRVVYRGSANVVKSNHRRNLKV